MDREEPEVEPLIERRCEECGAQLTRAEIEAALESGRPYLCSVHAAEAVTAEEAPESEPGPPPPAA